MPLVRVRNWNLNDTDLNKLFVALPVIVAHALHVEEVIEAHLKASDIEIFYENGDTTTDYRAFLAFAISVEAMHFPQREARRNEIAQEIADGIGKLGLSKFNVWLTLPVAGFAENYDS